MGAETLKVLTEEQIETPNVPDLTLPEISKHAFILLGDTKNYLIEEAGLEKQEADSLFSVFNDKYLSSDSLANKELDISTNGLKYNARPIGYQNGAYTSEGLILIKYEGMKRSVLRLDTLYVSQGEHHSFHEGEIILNGQQLSTVTDLASVKDEFPEIFGSKELDTAA